MTLEELQEAFNDVGVDFDGLDALDGYFDVKPEAQLTHPAGMSNLLAQYVIPGRLAFASMRRTMYKALTTRRQPRNRTEWGIVRQIAVKEALSALSNEERIGLRLATDVDSKMMISSKLLPAALGGGDTVFAARGVSHMPSCEGADFLRLLTSGKHWESGEHREYESYSLNIAIAANIFAHPSRVAGRGTNYCAGLIVVELPAKSIMRWGQDSESGVGYEAEIHVRPAEAYAVRGFILGQDLPFKKASDALRNEYALGRYIFAQGKTEDDMPLRLWLHPQISQASVDSLESFGLRLNLHERLDKREWYEVPL